MAKDSSGHCSGHDCELVIRSCWWNESTHWTQNIGDTRPTVSSLPVRTGRLCATAFRHCRDYFIIRHRLATSESIRLASFKIKKIYREFKKWPIFAPRFPAELLLLLCRFIAYVLVCGWWRDDTNHFDTVPGTWYSSIGSLYVFRAEIIFTECPMYVFVCTCLHMVLPPHVRSYQKLARSSRWHQTTPLVYHEYRYTIQLPPCHWIDVLQSKERWNLILFY
jgi:hypothetical protein